MNYLIGELETCTGQQ